MCGIITNRQMVLKKASLGKNYYSTVYLNELRSLITSNILRRTEIRMKILYYGTVCDEKLYNQILELSTEPYMVAQYSFETALLSEIVEKKTNIECQYIPITPTFPAYKKVFFFRRAKYNADNILVKYIPAINLPVIKFISIFISTLLISIKWSVKNHHESNRLILSSINYLPVSCANHIVARIFAQKNVCIFTDTTEFRNIPERIKSYGFLKRNLWPFYSKIVHWTENEYDGYILFSKYMNEIINQKKRPYVVAEGMFNEKDIDLNSKPERKNSILFAGSLFKQYGVLQVISAFSLIPKLDYELWIVGSGELNDEIKDKIGRNENIKFFGFLPRNDVFQLEKSASLLINIRDPQERFTRYSFPSKLFEYLASGTPVLTSRLLGIPDEYHDYLFFTETIDPEKIGIDIMKILNLSQKTRDEIGTNNRHFILSEKNASRQTEIILNFLNELLLQ